jgi:hypothetical protein
MTDFLTNDNVQGFLMLFFFATGFTLGMFGFFAISDMVYGAIVREYLRVLKTRESRIIELEQENKRLRGAVCKNCTEHTK